MSKVDTVYYTLLWIFVYAPLIIGAIGFIVYLILEYAPRKEVPKSKEELEQEHQWKLQEYKKGLKTITEVPGWMKDKEDKEDNTPDWL